MELNKITFHRAYEGGYKVHCNGELVDYIDRAMDGYGWYWQGDLYGYLSEAKARAAEDLKGE